MSSQYSLSRALSSLFRTDLFGYKAMIRQGWEGQWWMLGVVIGAARLSLALQLNWSGSHAMTHGLEGIVHRKRRS